MNTAINFKKYHYSIDRVLNHFGLTVREKCDVLDTWLSVEIEKSFALSPTLQKVQHRLQKEGALWNEEELKMHFLSILFFEADFEIESKSKLFYERPLEATVHETPVKVICDAFLATPLGINTPDKPYFFLQEFKKGRNTHDDAEGQMLLAMLIAQALNNDGKPIYGCYLQGRHWYFSTLQEHTYCVSRSYDAVQTDDLAQILHILRNLKTILL